MSKVYFIDLRATPKESFSAKLVRLVETAGLKDIVVDRDLVALKLHFGELGNTAFIRPVYLRQIVKAVRAAGARIALIGDGDISGSIATAKSDSGVDILFGIGGSPEAVTSACAMAALGGEIQARLWPRDNSERQFALEEGFDLDLVLFVRERIRKHPNIFGRRFFIEKRRH